MRKVLDLSQHNGAIDFAKVKQAGINDLILRVGWIGNKKNHTIDTRFHEYYTIAKANGFRIGIYVYSYCTSLQTLKDGINWTLNQLKNLQIDLPVFLDLEDSQISHLSKNELTIQAIEFCNTFNAKGYVSGVYASKSWFMDKLNVGSLSNHKIWLAEWNGKENHTAPFRVDLWQYTSKGKVDGINSNVDISKCLECNKINEGDITGNIPQNGDDVEVRKYQNGSTPEPVYSDTNLTNKVGSLNPWEKCECLGIFQSRPIVRYKVDGKNNYKIGYVKWVGGVK